jgi:5,10-methylenetetrahydromethanopterin reductase
LSKIKEFGIAFENLDSKAFLNCAKLAEDLQYGAFWVPEDPFYRGAFSLASAIAHSTTRIKVGIGVINPYTRHPVVTAMELATLDEFSGGRAILGLGASLKSFIEGQLNIPYVTPGTAIKETVEIIRGLIRGEHLNYKGRRFQANNAHLNFSPVRREVPIHLGVLGPKNLELSGEIADGVLLSVMTSPAYVRYAVEHARAGAERAGKGIDDFEIGAYLLVSISDDEQAARDAVKPFIAMLFAVVGNELSDHPMFACTGLAPPQIKEFSEEFAKGQLPVGLVTDWMVDTFAIAGNPERCREGLARIVEAGVTHPIVFEIPGIAPEKIIRSVHDHLMPHFL